MTLLVDVTTLGSHATVVLGDAPGDYSGLSVAVIGDFNGDGFDDFIVGATGNDSGGSNAGAAYLVYGKPGGVGTLDLSSLQVADGFKIQGHMSNSTAGLSVASAGDVNGDGFDDVLVGSAGRGLFGYGSNLAAALIFGRAEKPAAIDLTGYTPTIFSGIGTAYFGQVASAGDINGDGFDDIILGAAYDPGGGGAYVIFGKATGWSTTIDATALGSNGFAIHGTGLRLIGEDIAAAGDINHDGFADIIVAAHDGGYLGGTPRAYVLFGKEDGFADVDLSSLSASDGFVIQGHFQDFYSTAIAVAGAGDVNGDGFDDIIVGVPTDNNYAGAAYVIFGKEDGFGTIDLSALDNGLTIVGGTYGFGSAVSAAGDVNGDGFDDVLVGWPSSTAQAGGAAVVIFGRAGGATEISVGSLSAADGFVIAGHGAGDTLGVSVSGGADINEDGLSDILIGAFLADAGGTDAGASYVIYGQHTGPTAGTVGNDLLYGTFGIDVLSGLAGNDYLDGGAGADSLDGGADNDRIVYDPSDNPAQVSGGTGTDTLLVNDMAAPTSFSLNAHGFEFAERGLRDPGGHDWSSFVERYDANWQLLSKATFNDNGTNTWTAFDAGNAQNWDQIGFNYDAAGQQVSQDYRYDNGTRSWTALDPYDDQPWTQVWFTYDAAGHKVSEDYRYDDGGRSWVAFDGASNKPWDHIWFTYDVAGHQTSEDRYNDNGTRIWTAYDANANQAWSQSAFFYDNSGHLYQQVVTWDDGSTSTVNF